MTVADQPDASRAGKKQALPARPVSAFLPPEPRVELPSQGGGHRWMDLFRNQPEVNTGEEFMERAEGGGYGQKAGVDVADWLIMSTLDQKAPPPANGAEAGGDLLDAIVKDHLQRAAAPMPAKEGAAGAEVAADAKSAEAAKGENADDMLQREIDALLSGAKGNEPLEEKKGAEIAGAAEGAGLSQAELDVLVPPAARGEAGAPTAAVVDEETKAKLDEAEGVLAEELAQLMAETQAADAPAPAAETVVPAAEATAPAAVEETAAATVATAPAEAATSGDLQPTAGQVEAAASDSVPTSSPSDASAATPVATDATAATATSSPAAPGAPEQLPPPVVILAPDEEEEEVAPAKGVGRITRLFNNLGLMVAQLVDAPFSWLDLAGKNLVGFAAFLFLLSGAGLMAVAWWMARR